MHAKKHKDKLQIYLQKSRSLFKHKTKFIKKYSTRK